MLKYLCLLLFPFAITAAHAQGIFKGKVMEDKTRIGLANIFIQNLNNKSNTTSDKSGSYSLPAKVGDLVLFKGFSYLPDTVLVTSLNSTEIFLNPQKFPLQEVTVTATELKKPLKNIYDPEFHGQTVVKHRDREGNIDGGITMRLHYWKKGEHDQAKLEKKLKDFDTMDEIHGLFVPENIGKYVPLKGEELDNFIGLFTPGVKEYTRKDFNLLNYLNSSYKKYLALPPDQRKIQPFLQ
ncbi:hypothetical protein A0256_02570 [Mucilaginibacter sp. PAMC 26640]|nr:hypothetical protein A0256_02570 [Mucilaginibacter sp. PAMC 26640]